MRTNQIITQICNFHKDTNTQNKGKHIEQSIEYDDNNIDAKADAVSDSITCQTNTNNDKKYEKVIKKLDCTAPINEYNFYKDNTTQDKEKDIKQCIEHDENKTDGKMMPNLIQCFPRPTKITTIGLIENLN